MFLETYADQILAAVSFVFGVSLLPTVVRQFRDRACSVPLTSSVPTAAGLAVIVAVYAALGLWFAVVTGTATALCWAAVAVQRAVYEHGATDYQRVAQQLARAVDGDAFVQRRERNFDRSCSEDLATATQVGAAAFGIAVGDEGLPPTLPGSARHRKSEQ